MFADVDVVVVIHLTSLKLCVCVCLCAYDEFVHFLASKLPCNYSAFSMSCNRFFGPLLFLRLSGLFEALCVHDALLMCS